MPILVAQFGSQLAACTFLLLRCLAYTVEHVYTTQHDDTVIVDVIVLSTRLVVLSE